MNLITVIIPTYNRADKLHRAIDSVQKQTYTNLEILIVDDGSTDNTRAVVEALGAKDDRIRYICMPQNGGASAARNEGVKQAQGELIAFQDSDDFWKPDKLEKQMAYWQRHPEFSMIYCAYFMRMDERDGYIVPDGEREELEGDIFPWLLCRNSIGTPTMLMKKESFLEAGGFDTGLRSLEDWEFAIRFSQKYYIGYVDEPLVDAYYSPGGISSGAGAYYESRCRMIARYKAQMTEYGIFDLVVSDLFERAEKNGMLEAVKKMLMLQLTQQD